MRQSRRKGWIERLLLILLSPLTQAATFDCTIEPGSDHAIGKAHYRIWIPEETPELRGIIFRQHGCGQGARKLGLEHADDIQWQTLAQKHGFALMGSQIWAPEEDCSTWTMPEDGSANAFLSAIKLLARASGHAELDHVPWCLWGHSGGAIWTVNMAYLFPERIIAAFPRSGGLSPVGRKYTRSHPKRPDSSKATLGVPILFCYGKQEYQSGNRFYDLIAGVHEVFDYGRKHHAPWALAVHPDSEHENSQSRQLAIRFFDKIIPARLSDPAHPENKDQVLKTLPTKKHWIGLHESLETFEASNLQSNLHESSYLLNKTFAADWQSFCQNGHIPDTSPPTRPHNLRVEQEQYRTKLQWNAYADMESGIQSFRIYRKGKLIGEIAGVLNRQWNPTGAYQAWNYSDQPLHGRELLPMVFTDGNAANAQPEDYQVSTVNKEGLESRLTQGINLVEWSLRNQSVWTNLSDADFLTHWEGPDGHKPRGWKWENEILSMSPNKNKGSQTSLYSKEIYENFEFQFQFRIGFGGNSGVKYRMQDYDGQFLGPEYQILDDQQHYPGYNPAKSTETRYITGTLYVLDMGDWNLDPRHPPGTWNTGRIISNGNRIEHWINGVKIVDTSTHTEEFKQAIQRSKFKKWPHYGQNTEGRIMLQDHGTRVEFRGLKIKRLQK
ncbi:MAG TPA: hypothetical protein DCR17_14430 [Verrucomicrobiales bacterium]|nr:hypothetical protein [Pedosphaera sp.]MBL6842674.1 DUF1080 domain-containing protein [Verrucomicrobiae bacterium]HAO67872.1 hypothetical protein [Verrucomicrobiales bacterium]HCP37507.1 hypothetical protein [Verrucomicrobiales bacterium]|tara:strand:- start:353 stop:2350 length:1998 start_codon:yes stop_codon:yes gene_type:complete